MVVNFKQQSLLFFLIVCLIINGATTIVTAAPTTSLEIISETSTTFGEISTYNTNLSKQITVKYVHNRFFIPEGDFLKLISANKRTPTIVTLSVVSTPDWCNTSFLKTNLTMPINKIYGTQEVIKTTTMTVITEATNVNAKTNGIITVQADAAENGKLPAASDTLEFTITVDFIPSLDVEIINDVTTALSSNQWGNLTLKLNNTSNENIIVSINYSKIPDTISPEIELPQSLSIDRNSERKQIIPFKVKQLNRTVNQTQDFEIQISFAMKSDPTETGGDPIILTTTRIIKYNPATENVLDMAPAFIGIAIICFIIIVFFSFLALRQKNNQVYE